MSAVESMRFICGGCGYRARIPSSYTGKVILCPGCQQTQIASADGGEATGDTVRVSNVATAPGTGRFSVPEADGRLRFTCTGCGYSAKLASTYAGKAISCPKCKSPQLIPPLQEPEGSAGKAKPSLAPEPAAASSVDDGLSFDDEPAKPSAATTPATTAPRKPAANANASAGSDDDGLTLDDEPTAGGSAAAKPTAAAMTKPSAPKAPASALAPVSTSSKVSTKPGSGGVVRRGGRALLPASEPVDDEENEDDTPKKPAKPLPPWVQKLKEPRMMAIIGGCAALLILQIVLISGWAGASHEANTYREMAAANEARAKGVADLKSVVDFDLSKKTDEVKRLEKAESEAKAALVASEVRLTDASEQLKKAETAKADEYARRKKAEDVHDEMFTKLQDAEKKRNEEYRATTDLRRKYEEEVKLRKDLRVRLDEAIAASK